MLCWTTSTDKVVKQPLLHTHQRNKPQKMQSPMMHLHSTNWPLGHPVTIFRSLLKKLLETITQDEDLGQQRVP